MVLKCSTGLCFNEFYLVSPAHKTIIYTSKRGALTRLPLFIVLKVKDKFEKRENQSKKAERCYFLYI